MIRLVDSTRAGLEWIGAQNQPLCFWFAVLRDRRLRQDDELMRHKSGEGEPSAATEAAHSGSGRNTCASTRTARIAAITRRQ
jgi:hypothetical protein